MFLKSKHMVQVLDGSQRNPPRRDSIWLVFLWITFFTCSNPSPEFVNDEKLKSWTIERKFLEVEACEIQDLVFKVFFKPATTCFFINLSLFYCDRFMVTFWFEHSYWENFHQIKWGYWQRFLTSKQISIWNLYYGFSHFPYHLKISLSLIL